MFLNTFDAGASFSFSRDHATSFGRAAIDAELAYLKDFDGNEIRITENGPFIVLDGCVQSERDLARAVRVSADVVGRGNVICQLVVVPSRSHAAFRLI